MVRCEETLQVSPPQKKIVLGIILGFGKILGFMWIYP